MAPSFKDIARCCFVFAALARNEFLPFAVAISDNSERVLFGGLLGLNALDSRAACVSLRAVLGEADGCFGGDEDEAEDLVVVLELLCPAFPDDESS